MLEAAQYQNNAFVTLTYSDDFLPYVPTSEFPSLQPVDLQLFMKRLRKAVEPDKIRFYAVGEYGDQSFRPHYHLALFNFETCRRGVTYGGVGGRRESWRDCCERCRLIGEQWGKGGVYLGSLETSSAQYLAGYVTKKMTVSHDPRLLGRFPEFARMSLRPGIGADAMHEVAHSLLSFNLEQSQADVPVSLRHGKRLLPLGRYLRRKLRVMVGRDEKAPPEVLAKMAEEMLPMYEASKRDQTDVSVKSQILKSNRQAVRNMASKSAIFKQRKSL